MRDFLLLVHIFTVFIDECYKFLSAKLNEEHEDSA